MRRPMSLCKYFGGFKKCPQILCECGLDLVTVFQWTGCGTMMLWDLSHKKDCFLLVLAFLDCSLEENPADMQQGYSSSSVEWPTWRGIKPSH